MLGQPGPTETMEEWEAAMESLQGKPWGLLNYQTVDHSDMVMPLVRGYLIALIVAALFFWLDPQPDGDGRMKKGLLVGYRCRHDFLLSWSRIRTSFGTRRRVSWRT